MSALIRNQQKILRNSYGSTTMALKYYYPVQYRRFLSVKCYTQHWNNMVSRSGIVHQTTNNNTKRLLQAKSNSKCDISFFHSLNVDRTAISSAGAANINFDRWQKSLTTKNDQSIRGIQLDRRLYDTPSSKVEATVQTMKKQQKEKVDEMMKEVSNNAKANAGTDTTMATSAASATSIITDTEKMKRTTTSGTTETVKNIVTDSATAQATGTTATASASSENVPSTKTQDLKPVVVKKSLKTRIWEELVHYYHGFRLLFIDINICRKLLWRVLNGKKLTRRENNLLVRTTSDLFRLIPFSVFIIVPFMELLLPLFIKFFPGMLPSTFQTSKERENKLKQSLQVKLEMAKFLQKTLDEMAVQHKDHKSEEAKQFANFFRRIKDPNEYVTKDEIIKYASRFKDEITLDSLSREQLSALCRLLELNTMGTSNFLRFQLRVKLRSLAADDRVIAREGVQSLDLYELQQACKARGMRAYGLTTERLHAQLQEWIDLSLNEKVPPVLLLLSRAIFISDEHTTTDKLKETIRVLPDSVAAQTKAAIGELEGKIDNKTKIEVIMEEERKIKEERDEEREEEKSKATEAAEMLLDKAPTIHVEGPATIEAAGMNVNMTDEMKKEKVISLSSPSTPIPTPAAVDDDKTISSKDVELLSEALKTISSEKKTMIVEKEQIKEIKEELEDYKEDVEELQEVRNVVKEPVHESRAAKLLFKKVNKMIGQLDKVLDDLEKKQKEIEKTTDAEQAAKDAALEKRQQEIVHVAELMQAIRKVQQTSTESRLNQIERVLSKLDADKDGVVTVNEVINVIEAIGRENIKLDEKQIEEVITLLDKEQMIQAEEKIEKALAKSIKESDMIKAKKQRIEQRRLAAEQAAKEELKDTAPELKDTAMDITLPKTCEALKRKRNCNPQANIDDPKHSDEKHASSSSSSSSSTPTTKVNASAATSVNLETPKPLPPSATSSSTKANTKDKML